MDRYGYILQSNAHVTAHRPSCVGGLCDESQECCAAPISISILRMTVFRSHATLMLMTGVHPKIVQERLGHSGIAVTLDTYSHVVPGLQAAARRLDEGLSPKNETTLGVANVANV